jgi:hypothetical protein
MAGNRKEPKRPNRFEETARLSGTIKKVAGLK